ncbi:AmmeMemoRadiSam system radical SAM enzyme [Candidatus Sumerlaeota bacterium]|nr:AmmeMemoRadiSam system radical SAM enzyme [Candidatus Sumerlaeota bacterium]
MPSKDTQTSTSTALNSLAVQCEICPKQCVIGDGQSGDCRIRINRGGKLLATTFARPCALHVDPIEKKPLFHFLPSSRIFSIATVGCNMHCKNCQNWEISQSGPLETNETYALEPDALVDLARKSDCDSIAYTYTEPVVYYEYTLETSKAARRAGMRNALVTAAYINPGPLRELCRVTDAATVDVKFIDDSLYRSNCDGSLQPVLNALKIFREEGVWLEVSNLTIPTLNDDDASIRKLCDWIVQELGPDVPLHFLRFHPLYRLRHLPATPEDTLERAREIAMRAGVHFCYVGNIRGTPSENTYCPSDRTLLIRRLGLQMLENHLTKDGACPTCGQKIPGVWS